MNSVLNNFVKSSIIFILCSLVYGETIINLSDLTLAQNYTQDKITSLSIKTLCETLTDCSKEALECRKDSNGINSSCVYPEYLCTDAQTCYLVKNNSINKDSLLEQNNNITINCSGKECSQNQCINGQCSINNNSTFSFCSIENTKYQCGKLIGEKCTSDNECLSSTCDTPTMTCIDKKALDNNNQPEKSNKTTLYICIGIGIVVIIFVIVVFVIACSKHVEDTIENPGMYDILSEKEKKVATTIIVVPAFV
ncbi:hypothetical protein BCR36DRAFT_581245 [Piromyces finnis]|uniref:Uncharacterized protein n=1 Tax=Piromyces finnis TaxID=1754191 RepID=A0A1Y1VI01_9FUNG|nr:hypothetical protein BCR36DRAFT_581245 [Piromyces finnis]|eukprot:ORX56101.1 hypothetical protein BCR36DRAFT_581245 [Piromyces finnis]